MIGLGSDKNIHIMTDKSNYSQHQVIFQSFDKVFCHTCNVLFCMIMLWSPPLEGLAGKIIEKANIHVEIFYSAWCQNDLDLDFSSRSEYQALSSEKPI